ncbi:MAG: hypothetical protein IID39_03390 [Planctomycetes bacterium]|nr:hypothetical protein [Planctomycetota bacterium]
MAHAYTPGLLVTEVTTIRQQRILPIKGDVLVKVGDRVAADQVVARTFMPGDVHPINLANQLSLPPQDVPECVLKKIGDEVKEGEPLARTKGIFGLFKSEYKSPVTGTIETVSEVTGQMIIRGPASPVEVTAFVAGKVLEVIPDEGCVVEAQVSFVQGIFGIGGETLGPLRMACNAHDQTLDAKQVTDEMKGAVIVGGGRVTAAAIKKAIKIGVAAIVTGGIDDADLRDFLGYDLGVAITGSEQLGLTLVTTEGFGDIAMAQRTFDLLDSRAGDEASVNGATQIRAGVIRPEVVIPVKEGMKPKAVERIEATDGVTVGLPIRAIRSPYFGRLGKVAALPPDLHELESGSKARVFEVEFDDGERVIIPRANVELMER